MGRFILMYLPDSAKTLLKLSRQLRSGGVAVFLEPDYSVRTVTFPDVPLIRSCEEWFVEALRASGAWVDMGMRLHETYRSAGFRKAGSMVSHLSGCGFPPGLAGLYSETIRSVLPTIVKHDIASSNEIEIDTLAERLEAAVRIAEPQWVGIR